MNKLRGLHLYLGCVFAPLLIFFLVTGALQALGWHVKYKNTASHPWQPALALPTQIHRTGGQLVRKDVPLYQTMVIAMSVGCTFSALLGVMMAWEISRYRRRVAILLILGTLGPGLIVLLMLRVPS